MCRVNIDSKWWHDPRRFKLIEMIGDEVSADGSAVAMWRTATEFWRNGGKVPRQAFCALTNFHLLIESGLAKFDGEFYIVAGALEATEWLREASVKGSKGGRPRKTIAESENLLTITSSITKEENTIQDKPVRKRRSQTEFLNQCEEMKKAVHGYPKPFADSVIRDHLKFPANAKSLPELKVAVDNYRQKVIRDNIKEQYVIEPRNFLMRWRDYLVASNKNKRILWEG